MHNLWRVFALVLAGLVVLGACGGDDDTDAADTNGETSETESDSSTESDASDDAGDPADSSDADAEPATDDASGDDDAGDDAPADPEPAPEDGGVVAGGNGSAVVTLDNGESFEFSILCVLEPQEAAGSEILFTVVSYDEPYNLDITQFGEDDFGGAANISLYDASTFDTVWDASSLYGTEITLTLDGNTVRGEGDFFPAGDISAEPVPGTVEANC